MVLPATIFVFATGEGIGAVFTSATAMITAPVLLRGGVPLSVTLTSTVLVDGPWDSVGVHVSTPLVEFNESPDIGVSKVQVNVCGGRSMSVMTLVYVNGMSSFTVRLFVPPLAKVGGVLLRTVRTTSLPAPPP